MKQKLLWKHRKTSEANPIKVLDCGCKTWVYDGTIVRHCEEHTRAELTQMQQQARMAKSKELQDELWAAERERNNLQNDIQRRKSFMESSIKEIGRRESEMSRLRAEYMEIAGQQFDGPTACPTCGQDLPEDQVETAKARHNERQAARLAEIQKQGEGLKARNEQDQESIEDSQKAAQKLEVKAEELSRQIETIKAKLAEIDEAQQQINNASEQIDTTALEQEQQSIQDGPGF